MAAEQRNNKNSATEDELGVLHKSITKCMTAVAEQMLEGLEEGLDPDLVVDFRKIEAMQKWVSDRNGITVAAPEANEESELSKKITKMKEKQQVRLAANGGKVVYDDSED